MFRIERFVDGRWVKTGIGVYHTRFEAEHNLQFIEAMNQGVMYRVAPTTKSVPAPVASELSWEQEEKADPSGVDSKIAWAAKKVPLQMIPLKSLYGAARVFAYGRKKHGAGNFLRATMNDGAGERYAGADLRHLSERQNLNGTWDNESLAAKDPESGLPHIDHEIATLLMKRAILVKEGVLPLDPGEGLEPPKQ